MKLPVLPLVLTAVVLAPACARADLSLYGKLYAEVTQRTDGEGASALDRTTLDDEGNAGRIGLKMTQDLGSGLSAFGQYEFQANAPAGQSQFQTRQAFVGIKGSWGAVALGRFEGAYKITGGVVFDSFAYTSLQARGNGGMADTPFGNTGFISRAVQYETPMWSTEGGYRFSAIGQYGADSSPGVTDASRGSYLAGLDFGYGTLDLVAAASHDKALEKTNVKYGLKVRSDDITYFVQQEKVEEGGYDPAGAGTFLLGAMQYRVGNVMYVGQVGNYRSDALQADASYWGLGFRYYLARNIWAVVGYRQTTSDIAALNTKVTAVGLRYDF